MDVRNVAGGTHPAGQNCILGTWFAIIGGHMVSELAKAVASLSQSGAYYFIGQWVILLIGATIHVFLDRKANRRTARRVIELYLIWILAGGGVFAIYGGIAHISGMSDFIARNIGYRQSMFQWEVGWADLAFGVLGIGAIWKRDSWLTAAVVAIAVGYGGDAIGHIMQYVAHNNLAPDNVWAIPSDILQPIVLVVLLILYRMKSKDAADA